MSYLKKNTILKIDALEGMNLIEPGTVDLIIADLPYGITADPFDKVIPFDKMWSAINKIRKPNTAIVLFGQGKFFIKMVSSNIDEFRYDYVWNKVLKSGFLNSAINPLRQHENIAVFYSERPIYNPQFTYGKPLHSNKSKNTGEVVNRNYDKFHKTNNSRYGSTQKYPTSVLDCPVSDKNIEFYADGFDYDSQIFEIQDFLEFRKAHPSKAIHQTEKPPELCDFLVRTYLNHGGTLLDFCCGSGSFPLAAVRNGMNYYGFDIGKNNNPKSKYYNMDWAEISKIRIQEYIKTPKQINLFAMNNNNDYNSNQLQFAS